MNDENIEIPAVTIRETITIEHDVEFDKWWIYDLLEVMVNESDAGQIFIDVANKVDLPMLNRMLVFLLKMFPRYRKRIISLGRKAAEIRFNIKVERPISKFTPVMYLPEELRKQRELEREAERAAKELKKSQKAPPKPKRERKGFICVIDNKSACRVSPDTQQRVIDIIMQYPTMSSKKHMTEYVKMYGTNDVGRSMIDNIIKRMIEHGLITK